MSALSKGANGTGDEVIQGSSSVSKRKSNSSGSLSQSMTSADYYADSYSHFGIHEEMLKDEVRTKTYMQAIERNRHLFKDKIVLDVGCGTGILSMFCARAGAKMVYAVDMSNIAQQARNIVDDNGFTDKITVIQGKMEEIDLPVQYVDIIISEWMGYFLLYESMLDTVIYARDKYLRPETGIIMPDQAKLFICAIEDEEYRKEKIDFWDNVYGFNMSTIKDMALAEPLVDIVDPKAIISTIEPILHLNIMTCKKEDVSFTQEFKLKFCRSDYCHALVSYFECAFTLVHKPIIFSTSPFCQYTHWKQVVYYLDEALTVCNGEELTSKIQVSPNVKNPRDLDINITLNFDGTYEKLIDKKKLYRLR